MKYVLIFLISLFGGVTLSAQNADDTVCVGDTTLHRYFISNPEQGVSYSWKIATGGIIAKTQKDTAFVKWGNTPGLFKLSVMSTNPEGCSAEETDYLIKLTAEGKPISEFDYLQTGNYIVDFQNKSTNGVSCFWNFGNDSTSNDVNPTVSYLFDDTYQVTLITTNDCGSDTLIKEISVKKIIGFEDLNGITILCGPNPVNKLMQIKLEMDKPNIIQAFISDITGKLILEHSITAKTTEESFSINLTDLKSGIYFLSLRVGDRTITRKIIKE